MWNYINSNALLNYPPIKNSHFWEISSSIYCNNGSPWMQIESLEILGHKPDVLHHDWEVMRLALIKIFSKISDVILKHLKCFIVSFVVLKIHLWYSRLKLPLQKMRKSRQELLNNVEQLPHMAYLDNSFHVFHSQSF